MVPEAQQQRVHAGVGHRMELWTAEQAGADTGVNMGVNVGVN